MIRTIFAQPDRASARQQLEQVAASLERRFPQVASLLREAAEEVLAYMDFPPEHWRGIHSTNVLERLNRELARRCDVVGIFPTLSGCVAAPGCPAGGAARRVAGAAAVLQSDVDGEAQGRRCGRGVAP